MSATISVLLVDDDTVDRKVVMRALCKEKNKYEITEVVTAADGLRLAIERKFDAILIDYLLPDQNGMELLKQLRKQVGHGTAIVMLSRHEDETIVQRCLDAGAQDFLLKDEVNGSRLSRAIRHARYRSRIDDALQISHDNLLLMAEHDPLTGLCNRRGFERAISIAAARVNRAGGNLAVLLFDLDNFKRVNDTAGHEAGDMLLVEVTKRLSNCLRESDLLCRLGGDEFVIIVNDFENDQQIYTLANRLLSQLQNKFIIGEASHVVTASIGVAFYKPPSIVISDLLNCADMAMYQAKSAGRNQTCTYSSTLQKLTEHRANIKTDLYNALKNNEFDLFYQAQISAIDGSLGGIEALIRWQHPTLGLLLPNEFIPIAEESQLICEIETWVLYTAYNKFNVWLSKYPELCKNIALAVNISPRQVDTKLLNDALVHLLVNNSLVSKHLEIEISESAIIKGVGSIADTMSSFINKGLAISLDNFGTGYTSINDLKTLPISAIKINQSYVASLVNGKKDQQLLIALISLAKALEIRVVAQGIETQYQAEFCSKHGCDLLQGFYYCYPSSADEFETSFMSGHN